MFFSPDLLSKRDSGFGLLWLAATLGSKSAFKKLPRRSVMTADISQLCQLIAMPAEPLALRLSSNLLVGAARWVAIVNSFLEGPHPLFPVCTEEIFMSDVTTCFNTLKRIEREFRSIASPEGQLQMAQPSVKSSAVTLRADPRAVFSIEFDAMVTDWDEYLNLGNNSDGEYHPTAMKGKEKRKATTQSSLPPDSDLLRATACTLPENHSFLFANSYDASFGGSRTTELSSSQAGCFGFDDTFDGLDIGEGVGEDLVRELGEGWGAIPAEENATEYLAQPHEPFEINSDAGDWGDGIAGFDGFAQVAQNPESPTPSKLNQDLYIKSVVSPTSSSLAGTTEPLGFPVIRSSHSSVQHAHKEAIQPENNNNEPALRKTKRTRLMLDARTELTDEELQATRMHYLDKQHTIRCELELKRFERKQNELVYSLLWDAPGGVYAKELVDFWVDHFKAHVEARSGLFVEPQYLDGPPRQKRRKVSTPRLNPNTGTTDDIPTLEAGDWCVGDVGGAAIDGGDIMDFDHNGGVNWGGVDDYGKDLRSSEEPGQARRTSHPPPALGDNLGVGVLPDTFHSQHSALFPWDMAGGSSSVSAREGGIQLPTSDRMSVEHADARLRGSSASRRGSSLHSLPGNLHAGIGSPAVVLPTVQSDDDFVFDVPVDNSHAFEPRQSEANRVALAKNSYNFLEYAKMQYRSLPSSQYLVFDDVVPKTTSTARVAAAALYHCLVLATKDLLQVKQKEPYGQIGIRIV